uniref:V-SNARE coiled-coil homology domain-containing protein n=1 Tax=Odontella aurita TaxID=265563 RepID=A0A7S4J1D9_9STRA|mmetsp:Transcript_35645/g.106366  ORF Transcript_35645/g.106366 Transcript_35645/m.106366 type:complete len:108 (+) Transcript_35645:32-355(+)
MLLKIFLVNVLETVGYQGKLAMVNQSINTTKEIMARNIETLLERGETLEELDERATELNVMSKQFRKRAEQVKRFEMWQNAKHGLLIGTAVTAGVAVITVPPLIAIL